MDEIEKHAMDLMNFVNNVLPKNEIIFGTDINAAICIYGIYECEGENNNVNTINDLIGPHGNPRHNESGMIIRKVLWELDYRVASTFFDNNNKYDTWIHPAMKAGYQPDNFLILHNQLRNVINIAICITYCLGNEKTFPMKLKNKVLSKIMKIDNECLRTSGNSMFKEKVNEFLNFLSESEVNKDFPQNKSSTYSKNTLYNLQKMSLKEKLNIAQLVLPIRKVSPPPY